MVLLVHRVRLGVVLLSAAERLSQVALTEIVAVVLAYAIKSVVENLSKNNNWPDKGGKGDMNA